MKSFRLLPTLVVLLLVLCISNSYAQNAPVISSVEGRLIRTTPRLADIDKNSMYGAPLAITRWGDGFAGGIVDIERAEEAIFKKFYTSKKPSGNPVIQQLKNKGEYIPGPNAPTGTVNLNMDGQTFPGFAPSDNNLAVGPNHVIQIINHSSGSAFKIWNRSGTLVQASVILSSITGVSGSGDPVVLYDQLADRWVLTEFGHSGGVTSYINTLIMAVSTSPDPTGTWKVYSYNIGSFFVDYPKYAVWQNGYYATTNDFNTAGTSYLGSSYYAFDRAAMLAGNATATMIRTRLSDASQRYYSMAPVCQEGPNVSGQSGLFAFLQDKNWLSPAAPKDSLYVFEFTPNFTNPANSVVSPFTAIAATQPFNTNTGDVSQQGTSQLIQTLSQRLMHRVVYRNFGSSESIVCNTADLENSRTGVHWWELRRPGSGNWSIYQEGLWQPDNNNRFMGSMTVNANGDIGLLYNVSGSTAYPSARFTGRSSCDPLGQMTLAETVVMNGTTYESNNRYGDYNSLAVDPVNGSFWGTAQYNANGFGTYGNWATRIVNFTLTSSCGGNAGTVSGNSPLCIGQTATYSSNGTAGGTWSSSNTSVASVNASSGLVTALSAGTTNITYTVSGASSFKTLTVNSNANAGTISGASSLCTGASTTYTTNGNSGGTWSSDNTPVATVNASNGLVTGVAAGNANITYTVTNCGTASASQSITVTACQGPTVTCPSNISTGVTSGCSVSIAAPNPSIANTTTLTWTLTGATTGSSGNTGINYVGTRTFNKGVTTITYTATGTTGSQATCSFTVTVTDNVLAPVTCPANISKTITRANRCHTSISTPNPGTSGNCSVTKLTWAMTGALVSNSPATGINYVGTQTFPVGITTVTYTLTNSSGYSSSCSFTVTVRNTTCPGSPAAPLIGGGDETVEAITKIGNDLKVNVYPNPTETHFTLQVRSGNAEPVEISVYTIYGSLIQKMKGAALESFRFGDNYIAGTYIAKVQQGTKQTWVKLIK